MQRWRIVSYITACAAFAALVTCSIESYDIWFRIATGRWIATYGRIPTKDTFSRNATRFWQPHGWLFDLVSYYASGRPATLPSDDGMRKLVIMRGLLCGVAFVILMGCAFSLCLNPSISFLLSLAAIYASLPSLDVRPHAITVFLFIATVCLLVSVGEDLSWRQAAIRLTALFLCSVIWVNIHGGFLIGIVAAIVFALLGLTVNWERLRLWASRGAQMPPHLFVHLVSPLVMLIGSMLNPFGVHALTYPLSYWLSETRYALQTVVEWLPPDFRSPYDYAFLLLLCLCILFPAIAPQDGNTKANLLKRLSLAILCAMTAAMALTSRRNISLFAICSVPFMAIALSGICQRGILSKPVLSSWHAVTIMSIIVITIFSKSALMCLRNPVAKHLFPYDAAQFIKANALPEPLFNPYHWGGFLIAAFDGQIKVFIDGRADIYSADFLKRYDLAERNQLAFIDFLDEHRVMTALVDVARGIFEVLKANQKWQMVYRDIIGAVFIRRSKETAELLKLANNDELWYPETPWALFYRGLMCAERGQLERAIAHWRKALSLKPDLAEAAINIGNACAKLERWKEATDAFELAIKLLGEDAPAYLRHNLRAAREALKRHK